MKIKSLLLLFSLMLLLSSCATSKGLSIGDSRYLDLWCIQELSANEVLAANVDDNHNVNITVKIITYGEHYSRWESIQGYFTCVDHYTYKTSEGTIITVPVFVKTSYYENYLKTH